MTTMLARIAAAALLIFSFSAESVALPFGPDTPIPPFAMFGNRPLRAQDVGLDGFPPAQQAALLACYAQEDAIYRAMHPQIEQLILSGAGKHAAAQATCRMGQAMMKIELHCLDRFEGVTEKDWLITYAKMMAEGKFNPIDPDCPPSPP